MDKLFLLDAYALIYRAYYALIRSPRYNSKGMNTSSIFGFINTLEEVLSKENPSHIGVAFDPKGGTFRHEIYPPYKAQREETPEDIRVAVPIIKEIISAYRIPILEVPRYEADDVIGTLSKKADEMGIFCYMMTPDKDYAQLVTERVNIYRPKIGDKPCEILNPEKVCEKYQLETPAQMIDLLGLMGDSSDNIPGCPGVGEKTAQKLIHEFGSIENLIERRDELKGAIKEKVSNNIEQIRLSKFLATIAKDVPIELDMEQLKREEPDIARLQEIFASLEFRSLLNKLSGGSGDAFPSAPALRKTNGSLPDLFAQTETATPKEKGSAQKKDSGSLQLDLFGSNPENPAFSPSENQKITGEDSGAEKFSILRRLNSVPHDYQLVDTKEKREQFLAYFSDAKSFAFDTETDNVNALNAHLVGMSFCRKEGEAFYIPVPENDAEAKAIVEEIAPLLENPETTIIGQNIKYDYMVMLNYDVEIQGPMFDTMIAHYVLQPELHHGMDYLAEIYLHYQTIHIEELLGEKGKSQRNMRELPPNEVYEYACEDADVTLKLKNILAEELKKAGTEHLFYDIEMPLVCVLATMERNGVCVDTDSLKETSRHFTERMLQIEKEIYQLAGFEFNIASPKQVGQVLFERMKIIEKPKKTKTGQYVTSEEVLESLRSKHPIVEKILAHRGLKKLIGTYVDPLPTLINPRTGRIHTSFNQTVTATGRLSSSNPNLQNIPIRDDDGKEIRKAFIPDEGCEFFSADYSQIELRIMAHLSGDKHLIEAFQMGEDIHTATAAKVFKKPLSEVTKQERSKAKTANFGIIYGISPFGLSERLGVSRTEAKELIDNYYLSYPDVEKYIKESIELARENGYIETIFHRKRYLPDINSHNATVRGYAERNAINAPIQGSAADIIKVAMNNIYQQFRKNNIRSKMILQVHDELNFSVYPEEKEIVQRIVIDCMQNAFMMKVPLIADYGWGANWLEAH
ncbi:MAG: DNA polymerase I [Bacteroidaceae bacterium]|nr:DNA polymerase I [Bacteroidaceae bacterium]